MPKTCFAIILFFIGSGVLLSQTISGKVINEKGEVIICITF